MPSDFWCVLGLVCFRDTSGHTKPTLRVFRDLFFACLRLLSYTYIASICVEDVQHRHQYEKQIQNFFRNTWFLCALWPFVYLGYMWPHQDEISSF